MITYNDLYEFLRKERYSEQLQQLPKKFISDTASYIAEKKKLVKQSGDFLQDDIQKTKKQIENTNSIFKELILLRKKKLLNLVFIASETGINKRDFENMLDFEKELFDNLMSSVHYAEKSILSEMSNNNSHSDEEATKLVLFTENVGELMGMDGKPIGPFKKDDIVNLPKKIAEIFINDKKAEIILDD
ncbi:MAG: hypothetical protein QW727_00570 [Candidatus Pacearchaeota archaeon]